MITIPKNHLREMEKHAEKESPREACGVLAGMEDRVSKVYKCRNVSTNPASHYVISPDELIDVFNEIEKSGLQIIGFYHSHPSGPLGPSSVDHATATWHGHSYVILHPKGVGSWRWDEEEGRFAEEELQVL